MGNSNTTVIIICAAVLVLVLLLVLLARSGRKPPQGPSATDMAIVDEAAEASPVADPLPEPGGMASPFVGLATDELAEGASPPREPIIPAEAEPGPADPLTRMKGLGPKAEAALNALGVTRFDQIAAWTDTDVARIDARMGAFKGRIARDRWVEQARLLAAGDTAAFEATFGKLG